MEGGLVVNISGGSWLKLNIYKLRNLKFLTSTEWSYLFCNTSSLCSKVLFVKKNNSFCLTLMIPTMLYNKHL